MNNGEFSELFCFVWKEFQRILEIISQLSKDTNTLISRAEEQQVFTDTHKLLLSQSKDTVWRAIYNEKKLKKFYYKLDHLIKPFDKLLSKITQKYPLAIAKCNQLYSFGSEYIEKEMPKFIARVKESGNSCRIQVGSLIWKEDESALPKVTMDNKQPKIFLSNNITSFPCITNFIEACPKGKHVCVKTLAHFKEVFDFNARLFANISNLSRNLLYIKLNLEKFGKSIDELRSLIRLKCEYYKAPSEELKKRLRNDKIFKISHKLVQLENALIEESQKLESFIRQISAQMQLSQSTCIPLSPIPDAEMKHMTLALPKIFSQIQSITKFIRLLVNQKKGLPSSPSPISIYKPPSRSFIFQIFHIRSILLRKLQPYSISTHLQRSSASLLLHIRESLCFSPSTRNLSFMRFNILRDNKLQNSNSLSKQVIHSYNSSWDMVTEENNACVLEADEDSCSSSSQEMSIEKEKKNEAKKRKKTVLYTQDFGLNEGNNIKLPSVSSTNTQFTRTFTMMTSSSEVKKKQKIDFAKQIKKIKSGTNSFLNHRIKRIQNNKSITPMTKIECIREEFMNQIYPMEDKLKTTFLKLRGKSTYLYTMR